MSEICMHISDRRRERELTRCTKSPRFEFSADGQSHSRHQPVANSSLTPSQPIRIEKGQLNIRNISGLRKLDRFESHRVSSDNGHEEQRQPDAYGLGSKIHNLLRYPDLLNYRPALSRARHADQRLVAESRRALVRRTD